MKKILLSSIALATMSVASTSSELSTLKKEMSDMSKKIEALESHKSSKSVVEVMPIHKEGIVVKSKVPVLEFSGTHYLGFRSDTPNGGTATNKFETRRNYFQVKGFFGEDSKDYFRITLDTDQDKTTGDWAVRLKYAYLYLDNILPYTGVEIGQVHRPWIDYEEHHGWLYRSISKVLVEDDDGAHFTNSADLGINFKTKTDYFSSELGILNGAGYHGVEDGKGLSAEWRLTGHILGTGKSKEKSSTTYANISFFGQDNQDYSHGNPDFLWYGIHAVYNQPEFLISAQYVATSKASDDRSGTGFSVNGEYRFMEDWNLLARYDSYSMDAGKYANVEKKRTIAGIGYEYNKNVEFILNYQKTDVSGNTDTTKDINSDAIMLTACIEW